MAEVEVQSCAVPPPLSASPAGHRAAEGLPPGAPCRSHAEFLSALGEPVVELAGVHWRRYRRSLVPAGPMPVLVEVPRAEALRALRKTRTLLLRYTTEPGGDAPNWWHVICRRYDLARVSGNTRSKVRRGLKRLSVRRVDAAWLAEAGYDCHVRCYERYANASPLPRGTFGALLRSLAGQPIWETWGCFRGDELVGYVLCLKEESGVFMETIDLTPHGLRDYAAYAAMHTLLEHYVNGLSLPLSNGTRSIAHATEMQDYLQKFGFRRELCDLHVIYRPDVAALVRLLYPWRGLVRRLQRVPGFHELDVLLRQEEIARELAPC